MKSFVLIILVSLSFASLAERVDSLYVGKVQVANQSSLSQLQGIRDALQQVLIKLTGDSAVIKLPSADVLLMNSDDYVAAVGYMETEESITLFSKDAVGLEVNFSRTALDEFVRAENLPVLPANRPLLLLWIIRDDHHFGKKFVTHHSFPVLIELVTQKFSERGMPFALPVYDLQDRISLSEEDAWMLNADALSEASQRYESDALVLLRFFTTSSGEVRGSWLYETSGRRKLGDMRAPDIEQFVSSTFDQIIDEVARFYAYVPQASHNWLTIEVDGVESYKHHRSLIDTIGQIELVESTQIRAIRGTKINLLVEVEGDVERFYMALIRSGFFASAKANQTFDRSQIHLNWVAE